MLRQFEQELDYGKGLGFPFEEIVIGTTSQRENLPKKKQDSGSWWYVAPALLQRFAVFWTGGGVLTGAPSGCIRKDRVGGRIASDHGVVEQKERWIEVSMV